MDYKTLLKNLETGKQRIANKTGTTWNVNLKLKQQIVDLFQQTETINLPNGFRDKSILLPQIFTERSDVRIVPGGTSIRPGVYLGKKVVVMPPSYINIGAYIDDNSMVDSHVLVGSCAQIGKGVHLSTAVQIGGTLEPINYQPVIVEDDCFIGAGAILTEGILVRKGAIIAPNVSLSASVPIYDLESEKIIKGEIPENAVVVPGTRPVKKNTWGEQQQLTLGCAVIVKYRDKKTDKSIALEAALR
ncbi:2,3,4,5-tetrahydropyridine-2,6-dicarboxylate N-succinyltransferase [Candidatus Xenohaliotis californiensis]|uniref:2,3,4,5-tetrahydropyridine-2,6-dicarboxylate N-succinyltransferase n=1 Tax=Candidatus Xenohaliotis californiensis TaxID=84677 RepID=A0ABM9N884_9RICK|nr:2,3,4,5-tetrahydropyridine-2,6-dicarboxylate N-succinyltransferase [Candidatus Xenohaliotis californiensis]